MSVSPGVTVTVPVACAPRPPAPGVPQIGVESTVQVPPLPPCAPNASTVSWVTPSGTVKVWVPPVNEKVVGLVPVTAVPVPVANPIDSPPASAAAAARYPNLRLIVHALRPTKFPGRG